MTNNFSFYLPTTIIFNKGAFARLAEETAAYGQGRALIVCGSGSLKSSGRLDAVLKQFKEKGIEVFVFEGVGSDPDTTIVDKGIAFAKANSCNIVIGIGGGSVLDCAKAIAGLANEKGFKTSLDYLEVDGTKTISSKTLPFISVPTIAGTGAEITKNAVLVNPQKKTKRSIRHNSMFPALCLIDPELSLNAPYPVSAAAGIDALCHLLEGYISAKSTPLSDMFALAGLKLICVSLPLLKERSSDYSVREALAHASLLGGIVLSNSGLTLSHAIGSVIGPGHNIPHGISCSICLAATLELNRDFMAGDKKKALKNIFGEDTAENLSSIMNGLGIPLKLSDYGIKENDIETLAAASLNTSSAKGNPKPLTQDDVRKALKECL